MLYLCELHVENQGSYEDFYHHDETIAVCDSLEMAKKAIVDYFDREVQADDDAIYFSDIKEISSDNLSANRREIYGAFWERKESKDEDSWYDETCQVVVREIELNTLI